VWFDFDETSLLADLAEMLGGWELGNLPEMLMLSDPPGHLARLRERLAQMPASSNTAAFVKWILSRPN
jgi:hypothetical protein